MRKSLSLALVAGLLSAAPLVQATTTVTTNDYGADSVDADLDKSCKDLDLDSTGKLTGKCNVGTSGGGVAAQDTSLALESYAECQGGTLLGVGRPHRESLGSGHPPLVRRQEVPAERYLYPPHRRHRHGGGRPPARRKGGERRRQLPLHRPLTRSAPSPDSAKRSCPSHAACTAARASHGMEPRTSPAACARRRSPRRVPPLQPIQPAGATS